jgi:transcriptional regulator GlxA family with amidase domain
MPQFFSHTLQGDVAGIKFHALRIEAARQFLESGTGSVVDVGYRVGYEDPTFFRRLFRRTTGLAPGAYRRKYARIVSAR